MASIDGLLRGVYPPLPVGGGLSETPIMKPPAHSWITESNNQKILEVTNRIMELLAVRGCWNSGAVEQNQFLERIMEDHPPLTRLDGSRVRTPPEGFPHPQYSKDRTQENQEIPHYDQLSDEMTIKKVKDESEEAYVRDGDCCLEEDLSLQLPIGSRQEGYNTPHYYQEENLVDIKQEEDEHVRDREPCKEEISLQISADWGHAHNIQDLPSDIVYNDGIQSGNHILDFSAIVSPYHRSFHPQKKTFSCADCGRCFSGRVSLIKHQRVHTGEKPYSCPECGRCFCEKLSLIKHERFHRREKPYSCSSCGKRFSVNAHLIRHERIHTGERPYSCSDCGKCFSEKCSFITHKRVHTGEKPYPCSECGRCFSQKAHLIRHERVHTGEKPYSCMNCGRCFTNKSNLIRHEQAHTGKSLH